MNADERIQHAIENLPPLPEVALRVVQIVGDPDYETADLVQVIRTDPALTTRILDLCNSSLFGLQNPVSSVEAALPFLGAKNLLEIVVSTCTRNFFVHGERGYQCRPGELWRHSIACALASRMIARAIGLEETGIAFTAGVLHNVGKVALAPLLTEPLVAPDPDRWDAERLDFLDVERLMIGIDHASAGAVVTETWPLPDALRRAIVHHHDDELIATDPPLTAVVHLADLLCLQLGIGVGIDGMRYQVASSALTRTGLRHTELDPLRARLLVELRRHEELVKMRPVGGR